mmetsp:Transcript_7652/g.18802  ORF Transcript_7652/g.18802 Transcript_7652/m.18802 type:complete len:473 (+) Transcript_7652:128-1546(+)
MTGGESDVEAGFVFLDGFEELLEISLAEAAAAGRLDGLLLLRLLVLLRPHAPDPLNNLNEERGPIPHRLGEHLKQDALVVLVHQDAELLAPLELLLRQPVADLLPQALVIPFRGPRHELKTSERLHLAHLPQRLEDVVRLQRQVLHAGPDILLQVGLDLALPLGPEGWLVDGEEHHLVVAGRHDAVEARVHRTHVLRGELGELVEPGRVHEVVVRREHVWHVAHAVVQPLEAVRNVLAFDLLVAWHEISRKVAAQEPEVDVAVEADLGHLHLALLRRALPGLQHRRLHLARGAVRHRLPVSLLRIANKDAYCLDGESVLSEEVVGVVRVEGWVGLTVSVPVGLGALGVVRGGEGEAEVAALQDVARVRVVAGRVVRLGHELHAQAHREPAVGVVRVAAVKLNMVELLDIEAVGEGVHSFEVRSSDELLLGLNRCACAGTHAGSLFLSLCSRAVDGGAPSLSLCSPRFADKSQ